MPRGRRPAGDRPLTGAERQARYRAIHAGQPIIRYPRGTSHGTSPRAKGPQRADRRSRPQRWRDAVAELLPYRRSMLPGSISCPSQPRARQPPKRCKLLSISISTN
jgi:hypothetical protein